jgi:hypothetical protein
LSAPSLLPTEQWGKGAATDTTAHAAVGRHGYLRAVLLVRHLRSRFWMHHFLPDRRALAQVVPPFRKALDVVDHVLNQRAKLAADFN